MSTLIHSIQSDIIKTKRSSAFWLSLIGSIFIPIIFFLMYTFKPEPFIKDLGENPWFVHFNRGWQSLSGFLLPMFVILTCSLMMQIEYKNNTWKQVFASPQTLSNVFFSKMISIHAMIIFCILLFNVFMIASALMANLLNSKFLFLSRSFALTAVLKMSLKTYVSILAILAIQYWLSLRLRNFIAPIGIGLGLLITSLILMQWEHIDKMPYAFPLLTFMKGKPEGSSFFLRHEYYSMGMFVVLTGLALWDLSRRKERG